MLNYNLLKVKWSSVRIISDINKHTDCLGYDWPSIRIIWSNTTYSTNIGHAFDSLNRYRPVLLLVSIHFPRHCSTQVLAQEFYTAQLSDLHGSGKRGHSIR